MLWSFFEDSLHVIIYSINNESISSKEIPVIVQMKLSRYCRPPNDLNKNVTGLWGQLRRQEASAGRERWKWAVQVEQLLWYTISGASLFIVKSGNNDFRFKNTPVPYLYLKVIQYNKHLFETIFTANKRAVIIKGILKRKTINIRHKNKERLCSKGYYAP